MPLIMPVAGMDVAGTNLSRLADLMGVECVRVPADKLFAGSTGWSALNAKDSCLVINAAALKLYSASLDFTEDLAQQLTSAYKFILVLNLNSDPFSEKILQVMSKGQFVSVRPTRFGSNYEVAKDEAEICGPFSGLSFGFSNPHVDRVFNTGASARSFTPFISVDGAPLFARIRRGNAQIFFLGTAAIADLSAEINDRQGPDPFFSQLLPAAMLLRYMFAGQCWQPHERHATLVIDDPPLWPNYGYLNFERLLYAMDSHNFHSTIAFIPHNYRRNSPEVVQLFQTRPDRFSICFHGNDHTRAELGDSSPSRLNNLLNTAVVRMEHHRSATSLKCDKVMVFPQGIFSQEAMDALRAHNFVAAVNTEMRPPRSNNRIELADFIQPALPNYGFPLFIRQYLERYTPEYLAFNLFFGKPVFIGAHHDLFKNIEALKALIDRINSMCPRVCWSNLQTAINNSYLTRQLADGAVEIRSYANVGSIENQSAGALRLSIELQEASASQTEQILLNGDSALNTVLDNTHRRIVMLIPPGKRCAFDALDGNIDLTPHGEGFAKTFKAFCRRRLSEFRDNYLSKNPVVLWTAKSLQRHLQSSVQSSAQPQLHSH